MLPSYTTVYKENTLQFAQGGQTYPVVRWVGWVILKFLEGNLPNQSDVRSKMMRANRHPDWTTPGTSIFKTQESDSNI